MKQLVTIVTTGLAVAIFAGALAVRAQAAGGMVDFGLKLKAIEDEMNRALAKCPQQARRTVGYALLKKGQKVGNGQCTDLVKFALTVGSCWTGNTSDQNNYIWGHQRPQGQIHIGDIIQFEGCTFTTTTVQGNSTSTSTSSMPHHTSIVRYARGTNVVLLHQNLDGSPVKQTVLDLSKKNPEGRYTVFEPIKTVDWMSTKPKSKVVK